MAFCEVMVMVKSRWFREATKYLRITGDLQYITMSEDGFVNNDHSKLTEEVGGNENEEHSAEQSWRLGEDGDIVSIDAIPGHPSDIVITIKTRWRLSESWNLSIPNKSYFLTLLLQTGHQIPFINNQIPGILLGSNNESIIKGMLVVGSTHEACIEVTFQMESTTLYCKANGESVLTLEMKDIENIRLVSDLEPCGFVITHAGCPQNVLFNMKQQPHLLHSLLDGVEVRRALLGLKPLSPYLAVDLKHISPLPNISYLLHGDILEEEEEEEDVAAVSAAYKNMMNSSTYSTTLKFSAIRSQVSGLPRHGSQHVKSAVNPISCELVLINNNLYEIVYVPTTQSDDGLFSNHQTPPVDSLSKSSNKASSFQMFRNMKQTKVLSSQRLLSNLMCIIISAPIMQHESSVSKMVELQYLSGYCVCYEFPTMYHRNHFISHLLNSNYSFQHEQKQIQQAKRAKTLVAQNLPMAAARLDSLKPFHHIFLRASKKVFPLRVLPYHFTGFCATNLSHGGSKDGGDPLSEAEEMLKLEEELQVSAARGSGGKGGDGTNSDRDNEEKQTKLLKSVNEIHLTRFDHVAKRLAVELRRMKIAAEEEGSKVDIDVSFVRVPQSAIEFFIGNVPSVKSFSTCEDEALPVRLVEMLLLSFISYHNGQATTTTAAAVGTSSPGGLNVSMMAKIDETLAAHLEAIYHLLFYKTAFMNVSSILGATFVPWCFPVNLDQGEEVKQNLDSDEEDSSSDEEEDPQKTAARKAARKKRKEEREKKRRQSSTKHSKIFSQFMRLLLNTATYHQNEIVSYWSVQVLLKLSRFDYDVSKPFVASMTNWSSKSAGRDMVHGEEGMSLLTDKLNKAKESLISASGLDANTVNSGIDVIRNTLIDNKIINDSDLEKQRERSEVMKVEQKHRSILLLSTEMSSSFSTSSRVTSSSSASSKESLFISLETSNTYLAGNLSIQNDGWTEDGGESQQRATDFGCHLLANALRVRSQNSNTHGPSIVIAPLLHLACLCACDKYINPFHHPLSTVAQASSSSQSSSSSSSSNSSGSVSKLFKTSPFLLRGRDMFIQLLADNALFLNLLNTSCREAEPLMLEVMAFDEKITSKHLPTTTLDTGVNVPNFKSSKTDKKKCTSSSFRYRLQQCALDDSSFLKHFASAAGMTSKTTGARTASPTTGNGMKNFSCEDLQFSGVDFIGGQEKASKFLVAIWSKHSVDALSLLSRCLPKALLNILFDINPIPIDIAQSSTLDIIQRIMFVGINDHDENDEEGLQYMLNECDESNEFNDDFLNYKFNPKSYQMKSPTHRSEDSGSEEEDDDDDSNQSQRNLKKSQLKFSKLMDRVAFLSKWLGSSLSFRRWTLLFDLIRHGDVDSPHLIWNSNFRSLLFSRIFAELKSLNLCRMSNSHNSISHSQNTVGEASSEKGGDYGSSHPIGGERESLSWNHQKFDINYEVLFKPSSSASFDSLSSGGLANDSLDKSNSSRSGVPVVKINGLYIHLLLSLSNEQLISTLTSQALTSTLPISSSSLCVLAPASFMSKRDRSSAGGYTKTKSSHHPVAKLEEIFKLFQFVNTMKKELLLLALMEIKVPFQKLILEVVYKIVHLFKTNRFVINLSPANKNLTFSNPSLYEMEHEVKVEFDNIFSFPQMMSWCFKLLDTTEEKDIFNKSLKLIRLLVELHQDNMKSCLAYQRSEEGFSSNTNKSTSDVSGASVGDSSVGGSDASSSSASTKEVSMNSCVDALITVASLIHRRENENDQLDKFMIFKQQSSTNTSNSGFMLSNGDKQKELLLKNEDELKMANDTKKTESQGMKTESSKGKGSDGGEEDVGCWYYLNSSNKQKGPVSVKKLRDLLAQGLINEDTRLSLMESHSNSNVGLSSPSKSSHSSTSPDSTDKKSPLSSSNALLFRPLSSIRQLRWTLLLRGKSTTLIHNEEVCLVCIEILTLLAGGTLVQSSTNSEPMSNTNHGRDLPASSPIAGVVFERHDGGALSSSDEEFIDEVNNNHHNSSYSANMATAAHAVAWPPSQSLLAVAKAAQFIAQLLLVIGRPKVIDWTANLLTHLSHHLNRGSLDSVIDINKNNEIETKWRYAGPHLYLSGVYLFALSYRGSNLKHLSRFLETTHIQQLTKQPPPPCSTSFNHSNVSGAGSGAESGDAPQASTGESYEHVVHRSILRPLLPDALIHYLLRHGFSAFADLFLSTSNTPEAKWTNEMRSQLADTIDSHLIESMIYYQVDGSSKVNTKSKDDEVNDVNGGESIAGSSGGLRMVLADNVMFRYDYVPCPPLRYLELDNELYCHGYYLKSLCAAVPAWPIREPLLLLISLLESLVIHIHNFHSKPPISNVDALQTLGLEHESFSLNDKEEDKNYDGESLSPKRDKFLRKLRQAYHEKARKWHPDRNPSPEAKAKFTQIHQAYELLLSMATATIASNLGSQDTEPTHNISGSNELVLLLKTHVLLFNQHGEMLSNYKYPNYGLLLNLLTYQNSHRDPSTVTPANDVGSETGFMNHPLSWLTLIANVLLVTTNGGIDVDNNNIDSRLFNGGNAAALIESNGATIVADLLHYALVKLDKLSSTSAITVTTSSSSNKNNMGNNAGEQNEKEQLLHLIHILLSIICGPFASNLNFRNFLEQNISDGIDNKQGFDIDDEKNKGKRLICDLCYCLIKEQKPFFGTLILKGILTLLGTSNFVSENSKKTSAATNTKVKVSSGSVILASRLLNVDGFFKKLILMVLQYDSSLPLPRRRANAVPEKVSDNAPTKLAATTVEEELKNSEDVNMKATGAPLQLEKNTQALFALRLIRRLGCASVQVHGSTSGGGGILESGAHMKVDFYKQVRLGVQALFPGDMAYILLALVRNMDNIQNQQRSTLQTSSSSSASDEKEKSCDGVGDEQKQLSSDESLNRCSLRGVSILGVSGMGALDLDITTAFHQSAARRAVQASSSSISAVSGGGGQRGSLANGSVSIGNGGSMMNGMECITGEEENALCLLNMPSSTPSLVWSGEVQSFLVQEFCGFNSSSLPPPPPASTDIKDENSEKEETLFTQNQNTINSIHHISFQSILEQDIDVFQTDATFEAVRKDYDDPDDVYFAPSPIILKKAMLFRYPQFSHEICCCGIFLHSFISQHGEIVSVVSPNGSNNDTIDSESSKLNAALKVVGDPSSRVVHYMWMDILFSLLQISISSQLLLLKKSLNMKQKEENSDKSATSNCDSLAVVYNVSKSVLKSVNALITAKPKQSSSPSFQDAQKLSVLLDLFFNLCPGCPLNSQDKASMLPTAAVASSSSLESMHKENIKILGLLSVRILLKLFHESQVGHHMLVLQAHFKCLFDALKAVTTQASNSSSHLNSTEEETADRKKRETGVMVDDSLVASTETLAQIDTMNEDIDLNTRFMIILSLCEALFKSSLLCCEVLLEQGVLIDLLSITMDSKININLRTKAVEVIGSLVLSNQGQFVVDALGILLPLHFVDMITTSAQTSAVSNSTNLLFQYLDQEVYGKLENGVDNTKVVEKEDIKSKNGNIGVLFTAGASSTTSPSYLYIQMYDTDHSNPELVWNQEEREQLTRHVREFMKNRFLALSADTWVNLDLSVSSTLNQHEDLQAYLVLNQKKYETQLSSSSSSLTASSRSDAMGTSSSSGSGNGTIQFWNLMEKVSQRSNFGFNYINLSINHSGFSPRTHANTQASANKLKIGGIYVDLFLAEPTYELKHTLRFYQSLLQCLLQQGVYEPPKIPTSNLKKPIVVKKQVVNAGVSAIDTDGDTSDDGGFSAMNYNKINKVVAHVGKQVSKAIIALLLHSSTKERLFMATYSSSNTILEFVDILFMVQLQQEMSKEHLDSMLDSDKATETAAETGDEGGRDNRVKLRHFKRRQIYHECRSDDLVRILLVLSKSVPFAHTCCFDTSYRKQHLQVASTAEAIPATSTPASVKYQRNMSFHRHGILSGLSFGCVPEAHFDKILESIAHSSNTTHIGIATFFEAFTPSSCENTGISLGRSWEAVAVRLHTIRCLCTSSLQVMSAISSTQTNGALQTSGKRSTRSNVGDLVMQLYVSGLVHVMISIIDSENSTEISSLLISSINNNVLKQITSSGNDGNGELNVSSMDPAEESDSTSDNECGDGKAGSAKQSSESDQARRSSIVHSLAILHMINDSLSLDFNHARSQASTLQVNGGSSGASSGGGMVTGEDKFKQVICDDIHQLMDSSEGWEKSKDQHHDLMMVNNSVAYLTN